MKELSTIFGLSPNNIQIIQTAGQRALAAISRRSNIHEPASKEPASKEIDDDDSDPKTRDLNAGTEVQAVFEPRKQSALIAIRECADSFGPGRRNVNGAYFIGSADEARKKLSFCARVACALEVLSSWRCSAGLIAGALTSAQCSLLSRGQDWCGGMIQALTWFKILCQP